MGQIPKLGEPLFYVTDLSGRAGHYRISLSEILDDTDEHEDNEEFIEWLEGAEEGDEYTEFNNRTYQRMQ